MPAATNASTRCQHSSNEITGLPRFVGVAWPGSLLPLYDRLPRPQGLSSRFKRTLPAASMGVGSVLKHIFVPTNKKASDGRDQWPSRTSFILAAMGGCVGLGNILRYRQSEQFLFVSIQLTCI
jgi:hypothetical protein